jgi:hypothetical protein
MRINGAVDTFQACNDLSVTTVQYTDNLKTQATFSTGNPPIHQPAGIRSMPVFLLMNRANEVQTPGILERVWPFPESPT